MISDEYGNENNMATVLACGGLERKDQMVVNEMDGMAASVGNMGSSPAGNNSNLATVELLDYDYGHEGSTGPMEGRKMVVVVSDTGSERARDGGTGGGIAGDAEARLRLARLGSLLLSYYKKIRLAPGF